MSYPSGGDPGKKTDGAIAREIIRSIQKREGNRECFDTEGAPCEEKTCCWRPYCRRGQEVNTALSPPSKEGSGRTRAA